MGCKVDWGGALEDLSRLFSAVFVRKPSQNPVSLWVGFWILSPIFAHLLCISKRGVGRILCVWCSGHVAQLLVSAGANVWLHANYIRYFRKPLRGPPDPRSPQTPQQQKRNSRKPRLSPKVNTRSPKVSVRNPKVNVLSPKVNVK